MSHPGNAQCDKKQIHEPTKKQFTKLLRDIQSGAVSYDGRTSDGREFFFSLLNFGRWEMILPLAFAHPELLLHGEVSHILQSPKLLGDGFVLHSLGAAISVPGAPAQPWHTDAPYLFKESSLEQSGVAGHNATICPGTKPKLKPKPSRSPIIL